MVKRKGDLFNQVCELKNIIEADKNARKNKKKSKQEIGIDFYPYFSIYVAVNNYNYYTYIIILFLFFSM